MHSGRSSMREIDACSLQVKHAPVERLNFSLQADRKARRCQSPRSQSLVWLFQRLRRRDLGQGEGVSGCRATGDLRRHEEERARRVDAGISAETQSSPSRPSEAGGTRSEHRLIQKRSNCRSTPTVVAATARVCDCGKRELPVLAHELGIEITACGYSGSGPWQDSILRSSQR
jgi:hypothetical protein